ncbi:MAG: insulinase family protein [Bacteroidota bacterium]
MKYPKSRFILHTSILFLLGCMPLLGISQLSMDDPIPFDPDVRTGILDNGLTYYIKANKKPEKIAELRLAVNAGSLQETDAQQGLAHFLEHMCFNGTKNFPKNEITNYMESIGSQFGAHVNAYTSFDETVYQLRVPTDEAEKFERGMQILEDWAHNVTMEGEEIDKERGIVIEEWRSRLGAQDRMQEKTIPAIFYNSRYADRLPIGKKEILETFEYEAIRSFYRKWYRTDLMAVVVVGDVDVDEVEQMIKDKFGPIPAADTPNPRVDYEIPDHQEPQIAIAFDKEASYNVLQVLYKHPKSVSEALSDYRKSIVNQLASRMIGDRMQEKINEANPPFNYVGAGFGGGLGRTKAQYGAFAVVPENGAIIGLQALMIEHRRAQQFGFTQSELDRNKRSLLTGLEKQLKEKGKTPSRGLASAYVSHYLRKSPVPGPENRFTIYQQILPTITLDEVNEAFKNFIREDNFVVTLTGVEKEGVKQPTKSDILAAIEAVSKEAITAYEDNAVEGPLLAEIPNPGSVTAEENIESVGVTKLTLSNGIVVYLKPTTFQNDQILMRAYSPGGSSLYTDETHMSVEMSSQIVNSAGLGAFDDNQLTKYLSDKVANVSPSVGELSETLSGNATPKDVETMFQMLYLYMTAPRTDAEAFQSMMTKQKSLMANILATPERWFTSEMSKKMYNDHPRRRYLPTEAQMDGVELEPAMNFYRERFADANDFTFFFVGNFEIEAFKKYLTTYLATLPVLETSESWRNLGIPEPEGRMEQNFYKGTEPKSVVNIQYYGDFKWTSTDRVGLNALTKALTIELIKVLREEKSGVYSPGVYSNTTHFPEPRFNLVVTFSCAPENVEELVNTVYDEMNKMKKNGPSEETVEKVKEALRKSYQVGMESNSYWLSSLVYYHTHGLDMDAIMKADERINQISTKSIKKVAKKYISDKSLGRFVLLPETEKVDR